MRLHLSGRVLKIKFENVKVEHLDKFSILIWDFLHHMNQCSTALSLTHSVQFNIDTEVYTRMDLSTHQKKR